jgi:hypothetical protein
MDAHNAFCFVYTAGIFGFAMITAAMLVPTICILRDAGSKSADQLFAFFTGVILVFIIATWCICGGSAFLKASKEHKGRIVSQDSR